MQSEREFLEKSTLMSGGKISYKDLGDGTQAAYELNINYQDALAAADEPDEYTGGAVSLRNDLSDFAQRCPRNLHPQSARLAE